MGVKYGLGRWRRGCKPFAAASPHLLVLMGMSRTRVNEFIKELEHAGLIEIQRRGQGKTNLYKIKFVVKQKARRPKS